MAKFLPNFCLRFFMKLFLFCRNLCLNALLLYECIYTNFDEGKLLLKRPYQKDLMELDAKYSLQQNTLVSQNVSNQGQSAK